MGKSLKSVEFFLPRELLFLDADQWTANRRFGQMGQEYRVVVRLLDRFTNRSNPRDARFYRKWEEKWQTFKQNDPDLFCWHDHHRYQTAAIFKNLNLDKNCLVLTFIPQEDIKQLTLTDALYQAGIPVALFHREKDADIADCRCIENELKALIEERSSDLPQRIVEHRNQAPDQKPTANRLTLLWDNPDRMPPAGFYQAPPMRG